MRTRSKLLLAALAVSVAMAAATATSDAGRLSVSEQRFRITWAIMELSGFSVVVRCSVTLEGSYHSRTSAKTAEALVGYITSASLGQPCTGGEAWIYNGREVLEGTTIASTLPWHIRYGSFGGTLPNITEISDHLIGARFLIRALLLGISIRCNYTTTATEPANGEARRNTVTRAATELESEGSIRSENMGCPIVRFSGLGTIATPGGRSLTVTLI
ncbi:MAG: hypothetical protein JSS99_08205 [Actinobacteria bacterium]|nr:hypothetical protein [Actinomycetota bacterium]